jgi:hypothetical protein
MNGEGTDRTSVPWLTRSANMSSDYEKLGLFYLGREFDPAANALKDDLVLYDSKDLTTHAVCVGMTGSGKTGLCLSLLEEAAIDGVPAICIDPKGDLGNLLGISRRNASRGSRPQRTSPSTRRAPRPAYRSPCSARSPPPHRSCWPMRVRCATASAPWSRACSAC